jgi:hypothetical protein
VSEARLRRYQRWVNGVALFVSLDLTTSLIVQGEHGSIVYYVALFTPFVVGAAFNYWLRVRSRTEGPVRDLGWVWRWVRAPLMLRDHWWTSPTQIVRAWLISGVATSACAFAVYRDLPTSAFVGIVYPAIVLGVSVRHFRHPPDSDPPPPAGWYPDPAQPDAHRYWDGLQWTDSVRGRHEPPGDPLT